MKSIKGYYKKDYKSEWEIVDVLCSRIDSDEDGRTYTSFLIKRKNKIFSTTDVFVNKEL